MDFLTGVNRLLRRNNVIKGDDDNITTFSDNQHAAKIELSQIAIQDELNTLVSDRLIPYEKTSGSIVTVENQRTYELAADFVRLFGEKPYFYYSTDNQQVFEYPGGEDHLRLAIPNYQDMRGNPTDWYIYHTTTKQVGLYQTPDATHAGRTYTYEYERDVTVSVENDNLPFHSEAEAQSFIATAARRYQLLELGQGDIDFDTDAIYLTARRRLFDLMRFTNPKKRWGVKYG